MSTCEFQNLISDFCWLSCPSQAEQAAHVGASHSLSVLALGWARMLWTLLSTLCTHVLLGCLDILVHALNGGDCCCMGLRIAGCGVAVTLR